MTVEHLSSHHDMSPRPLSLQDTLNTTLEGLQHADQQIVTDAALQLTEHITRLVAGAKQGEPITDSTGRLLPGVNDLLHAHHLDHTLAGQLARVTTQHAGDLEQLQAAHLSALLDCGFTEAAASSVTADYTAGWKREVEAADQKYKLSVLPGSTVLEHYSALSLNVIASGGLQPKSVHGLTRINDGSQQVHFTSNGGNVGEINYRSYATRLGGQLAAEYIGNPELKPMAGVFSMRLSDAIRHGYNRAIMTTGSNHGLNFPIDMVLANHEGGHANFGLEALYFSPLAFNRESPHLNNLTRFPYEAAYDAELDSLRAEYAVHGGDWQEYCDRLVSSADRAKAVLTREGIDPAWVGKHVLSDPGELVAHEPDDHQDIIVPLALASTHNTALQREHIDGPSSTAQSVYLGIRAAA